jgi:hypothetical protein
VAPDISSKDACCCCYCFVINLISLLHSSRFIDLLASPLLLPTVPDSIEECRVSERRTTQAEKRALIASARSASRRGCHEEPCCQKGSAVEKVLPAPALKTSQHGDPAEPVTSSVAEAAAARGLAADAAPGTADTTVVAVAAAAKSSRLPQPPLLFRQVYHSVPGGSQSRPTPQKFPASSDKPLL